MKAIELTEKHKEMLLEMCKKLFSQYDDFWFLPQHSDDKDATYIVLAKLYKKVIKTKNGFIGKGCVKSFPDSFHWFEFSWKILNKILEVSKASPLKIQQEITLYGVICFNDFETCHPVEHLYTLFNKHFKNIKSC